MPGPPITNSSEPLNSLGLAYTTAGGYVSLVSAIPIFIAVVFMIIGFLGVAQVRFRPAQAISKNGSRKSFKEKCSASLVVICHFVSCLFGMLSCIFGAFRQL